MNEMSQLEGVLHDNLSEAVEWGSHCRILDATHKRVFQNINRLGNAAKHMPTVSQGLQPTERGAAVAVSHQVLRDMVAQL